MVVLLERQRKPGALIFMELQAVVGSHLNRVSIDLDLQIH